MTDKSNQPKVLVTGAAGKTGAAVVEQMLERGFPVRASVRRNDERASRLELLGAEVLVGDMLDLKAVAVDHQDGLFRGETDVVQRIGGQPPQALNTFIHEHRAGFSDRESIKPRAGVH